jgi:hypothetical protein
VFFLASDFIGFSPWLLGSYTRAEHNVVCSGGGFSLHETYVVEEVFHFMVGRKHRECDRK